MVAQKKITYKLIKKVKDTKFSIDNLDHYFLIIQVGVYDVQFGVIDSQSNQVMCLEDYKLQGIRTINGRLKLIKTIFDNHEYLTARFWKGIKLSIKTHKFSLIPSAFFIKEAMTDYLALNSEIKTAFEYVNYYKQHAVDVVNIFAAEKKMCGWFESIYNQKKVHIVHQGSALIEGFLKHAEHINEKSLYAFIDRGILHLVVTENKRLLFYNQFAARKKEDYLKYIMLVFNELDMSAKKNQVFLWGFIKPNSEEMSLIKRYIRNVSFGYKPSFLKFSYLFDEIEDHHYFDLLSGYSFV